MGEDLRTYSPLALAYLGDAVYERFVRAYLLRGRGNLPVEKYHVLATRFVRAQSQAKAAEMLADQLDEEEKDIFRRGKNARSHAAPKSAANADYHRATGFEAVLGYLELAGRKERLTELMEKALRFLEEN
ncbi:MAG: ribonuclease III [Lachnospiraceae bacterium]|nr:ribonuclease III [Lachnospiraceae bacterium]